MTQGLLIWFNQTGDKKRQWAINHPVARDPGDQGGPSPWSSDMSKATPRGSSDTPDPPRDRESGDRKRPPGRGFGRSPAPYPEIRILTSKKDKGKRYIFKAAADIGIYVKCSIKLFKRATNYYKTIS